MRSRRNRQLVLVEGPKLIREAIRSGLTLQALGALGSGEGFPEADEHVPRFEFSASLMKSLSEVETHQGVLALVERPRPSRSFLEEEAAFILVLDGLQDPGNVGTLFRTAEAAGVSGILLTRGCADPFSPRALRASAGSVFRLPHIPDLLPEDLLSLLPARVTLIATAVDERTVSVFEAALARPIALALGSEGSGLDPRIAAAAGLRVKVPSVRPVESLNVGAAGAIVLFEIARRTGLL